MKRVLKTVGKAAAGIGAAAAAAGLVLEVAAVALSGFTELPLFLITELLFLFFMLYYASLMFVAYFRLTGEERMDLKKKFG